MNEKHYIGSHVMSFERYDETGKISGVSVVVDDEGRELIYGDDSGYVFDMYCPYVSLSENEGLAENILSKLQGNVYKGFRASGAKLPLTAELGDGVTVNGIYSMLAYRNVSFGSGHVSEIAAPGENAIDHEYPYFSSAQRNNRKIAKTRSSITKNVEEIKLLVEQINSDLTENYAKLSVVSEMISSEVRAELYTDDVDEDGNPIKVAKYSTVEQTAESITAAINGLDGKYLEVSLLPEGMFVTDESGNYTKISGGVIETDSLQLKGVIAFGDLSDYEAKQQEIDDAADAADEATKTAKAIANGTYAGTFINETSIYSPTIYGNEFNVISDVKAGGSFNIHGYFDEELYHFLKIDYADGGTNPFITFSSPDGATASWAFGDTLFGGNCDFNSASVSFNYSTVDFSRATKVTFDPGTVEGLGSVTAVFG